MSRLFRPQHILTLILPILLLMGQESAFGLTKKARTLNVLEFYTGRSKAHGIYEKLGDIVFTGDSGQLLKLDADFLFDNTFTVGFNYGQNRGDHITVLFGFRYTDVKTDSRLQLNPVEIDFRQFDLELNVNYSPLDIKRDIFSPYFGVGVGAGIFVTDPRGLNTINNVTAVVKANFGADFKLFSGGNRRSFVTLSSVNSWDILAGNNRPKYLNIGGALKYWFRL